MAVFGVVDPFPKGLPLVRIRQFGALVGNVGIDIAVQQDRLSGGKAFEQLRGSIVPVFGIQESDQLRMDRIDIPEAAAQELAPRRPSRYSLSLRTWVDFPAPSKPSITNNIDTKPLKYKDNQFVGTI